ncbi:MAG: sporulation integral membrane protein YtvI [Clostridium sp. 44_14]|uniref:sporulation integral membrane protein YtvI n=1 Tax=Jutongia sp. TaxID=2944204 RepID=UPI000966D4C6|nr:MAG: sporulation integral membrane protein YtvI [Clostridium sp. 44_14]RHU98889.1 sporulation integral membrane protein YtvI [Clostridium sp. OM07-9AC]RHV06235.1 sporulation integral membrane protein YtvI [Clostridium sp. OM07-10AC]
MEDRKDLHRRILVNLGVALAGVLFLIFVVPQLVRFLMPLIVAWIVAMIANPIIRFLEKRIKIMRKHGSALVIILVLAALIAAFYGLAVLVASQFSSWVTELPEVYDSVTQNLQHLFRLLHQKYNIIPADVKLAFDQRENMLDSYIQKAIDGLLKMVKSGSLSKVSSLASSLMDFLVYAILTILASYFMTVEKDHFTKLLQEKTPAGVQRIWDKIKKIFIRAIGGYFKAHFQIMIVIFFITVIPFAFMGISYSGLLAVVIAIVDFLPFFGAGTVLVPWAVYRLVTGSYTYAAILFVIYVVVLIVRQALEPKLIGDNIGTSPFETLVFMLVGYRLAGMLGLIVGIPVGMILVECYREGMFDDYIRGIKILARDINEYRKY